MAHITIGTSSTRADFTASASQTVFTVAFEFFDEDDLLVYQNNVLLTKTTNYTVTPVTTSDGGFDGGTVTLVSGASLNDKIAIVLSMPFGRSSDFPTAGPFNVTTLNTTLDKNAVRFKQLDEIVSRSITGPTSEGALEELPNATTRASRLMSFDASGNPSTVAADSLSLATLQAFTDYRITNGTGNGSTTTLTLSADPGQEGNTQVYIDGVYQSKGNYSIAGTTLTFSTAPPNGSSIEVVHGQAAGTYVPPANTLTYEQILQSDIDTDLSSVSGSDDTLASAKAIKTYVDAQVDTVDTLAETLAIGNTTGGTDLSVSANDDVVFANNSRAIFGDDLAIYHNGSHSYITEHTGGTGNLYILASNLTLGDHGSNHTYLSGTSGGATTLFYDNTQALTTGDNAVTATGHFSSVNAVQSGIAVQAQATEAGFNGDAFRGIVTRASNAGFNFLNLLTSNGATQVARIAGDGSAYFNGTIDLGHASDTTVGRYSAGDISIEGNVVYRVGGLDVGVVDGGTGASTHTAGSVLLGNGTSAIANTGVLSDGQMIVGDGSGAPALESGATLRTSIGVGTGDSPQFTGLTTTGDLTMTGATSGRNIVFDASDNRLEVADNAGIAFGDAQDFQIYHDGNHTYLTENSDATGNVYLLGTELVLGNFGNTKTYFSGTSGGASTLYYNNVDTLRTGDNAVSITGHFSAANGVQGGISVQAQNTHASFNGDAFRGIVTRASNVGFNFLNCLTSNGATQVARIAGDGSAYFASNVGIKVSSPNSELHVHHASSGSAITLTGSSGYVNQILFGSAAAPTHGRVTYQWNTGQMAFATGGSSTPKMTIASDGATALTGTLSSGAITATGDSTFNTVNVNAATSAGRAAAIGYAAADGLTLTGQGSTGDITLRNDAAALVCYVKTGTNELHFPDNAKAIFGDNSDLSIYSGGSSGVITAPTNLRLYTADWGVSNAGASESMISAVQDGAVSLFHNGVKKFETTANGANVSANSLTIGDNNATGAGTPVAGDNYDSVLYMKGDSTSGFKMGVDIANSILVWDREYNGWQEGVLSLVRANGNVGIGIKAPDANHDLEVWRNGGVELGLRSADDGASMINFGQHSDRLRGRIYYTSAATEYMSFAANGNAERVRIGGAGGSTGVLFVNTTVVRNVGCISVDYAGNSMSGMGINDTDSGNGSKLISFLSGGTYRGGITNNNNTAVAYNTTSDARLKENSRPIPAAADRIQNLKPSRFEWKSTGHTSEGFLAQEVLASDLHLAADAVTGDPDGDEMLGMDYGKLTPLLTAALQEALTKIDALEARIVTLEGN